MSEFLAEASVLVRANTALFKEKLLADVTAAVKAAEAIARVPVTTVTAKGGKAATAGLVQTTVASEAATAATIELTAAINALIASQAKEAETSIASAAAKKIQRMEDEKSAVAVRKAAATRNEISKGVQAQAASLAGLRGNIIGANTAFLAATAGAILFAKAVQSAADLQTQLNVFQATAGATADQMDRVAAAARDLGADLTLPGVSAGSAATSLTELAKAGLSVEDSLGAARGVLQLSSAAAIDNQQAVELVASALNAFALSGNQAVHVADLLAGASKESQGSITDMGIALQQSAAAAAQAGISVEDTIALITGLARAGLKGSDAGTSLRTALIRLINPSKKAQEALGQLGVNIRDAQGNIRPEIFGDMAKALEGVSKAQRDATLAVIFGQDAFRAAAILGGQGAAGLNSLRDSTNQQGLAAELAAARTKGFAGQIEALKNSLATLGTSVGSIAIPALSGLADSMNEVVGVAGDISTSIQQIIDKLPGLSRGGATSGTGLTLFSNFGDIVHQLRSNLELVSRGEFGGGVSADKEIARLNQTVFDTVNNADDLAAALQSVSDAATLRGAGGGAQKAISDLRSQFIGTGQDIDAAKEKLDALSRLVLALGRAPTVTELKIFLDKGSLTDTEKAIGDLRASAEKPISLVIIPPKKTGPGAIGGAGFGGVGSLAGAGINIPTNLVIDPDAAAKTKGLLDKVKEGLSPLSRLTLPTDAFQNFVNAGAASLSTAAPRFAHSGELSGAAFADGVRSGILDGFTAVLRAVNAQAGGLVDAMNRALAAGAGPQTLKGIAEQQLAAANKVVAEADKKLADSRLTKGSPQRAQVVARRSAALKAAAAARADIESQDSAIQSEADKAAADRKAKAQAARDALDKADQAVIDAFTPKQNRLDLRAIQVGQSENLRAQLALQVAIANEASREIAIIDKTVKDQKTRDAAIAERVKTLATSGVNITSLLKQIGTKAKDRATAALQAIFDLDQARLQLAQLQVGPEGQGKDAVLAAFDKVIADAIKQKNAAKKGSLAQVQAQIQIQQFIKDRRDFLKGLEQDAKDTQGTTAFDLLTQFADTFNQNAGNLINQNQPFAGPTGFTADIAQFLVRRPQQAQQPFPGKAKDDRLVASQSSLIDAINANTEAVNRASGNTTVGVSAGVNAVGQRGKAMGEFWKAKQARDAAEARSGV